jgi:branched-chain amino acid transport system permease protein
VVTVALLPVEGLNSYWTRQAFLVLLLALVVSGLNLTWGYAGELVLGQVAIYAASAYAAGYFAAHYVNDLIVDGVIAVLVALVVGLISGIPGVRLGGWILAIVSLFLVILVPDVTVMLGSAVGGSGGLSGIPLPELFGHPISTNMYFTVAAVVTAGWFLIFRNLARSPHGRALLVMRESQVLASAIGANPRRLKLNAYLIAAIPAGIAGTLFAFLDGYVSPSSFGLNQAIELLAACIIGGAGTIYGPILGAVCIQAILSNSVLAGGDGLILYGAVLAASGIVFTRRVGVVTRLKVFLGRHPIGLRLDKEKRDALEVTRVQEPAVSSPELEAFDGRVLRVQNISKNFGGIPALASVTFEALPGQVTALIGPNGSGKTTLLNVICGFYRSDSGTVHVGEVDITGLPAYKIARAGLGRTFQTPIIPRGLTVAEVVACGRYGRAPSWLSSAFRLPRFAQDERESKSVVGQHLTSFGLQRYADAQASSIPLGSQRLLELSRIVASRPSVLLLDEVASGLDINEIEELSEIVRAVCKAGATVILVEHNFSLVQRLAEQVIVLAEGALIATGSVVDIANNKVVLDHYLGRDENALDSDSTTKAL